MNRTIALLLATSGITVIYLANPRQESLTSSSTNLPYPENSLSNQLITRIHNALINEKTGLSLDQISKITTTAQNSYSNRIDLSQFQLNPNGPFRMEYIVFPEEFNNQNTNLMIQISIFDKKTDNKLWETIEKLENR